MTRKNITIDVEAYDLLVRHRRRRQSFSSVLKERFARPTARSFRAVLRATRISESALDAMERQVRARADAGAACPRVSASSRGSRATHG